MVYTTRPNNTLFIKNNIRIIIRFLDNPFIQVREVISSIVNCMHEGKLLSIVIPALNEEEGIKKTICRLPLCKLRENGYNVEILVIDCASSDNTCEVASGLGARVIVEMRKGYGRAYKTRFSIAKGSFIVTLDADDTYPSEIIPSLIGYLEQNEFDFITVNRFSELEEDSMSRTHLLGNFILSACLRTV